VSIDQRKSSRLDVNYQATVRHADFRQMDKTARLNNISQGGVCFVSTLQLQQGDPIEVELPASSPIKLKFKVIWCRPQRDWFSAGAEYVETSEARRARVLELHQAILDYHQRNNGSGDLQQSATEWLNKFAVQFLAGTP